MSARAGASINARGLTKIYGEGSDAYHALGPIDLDVRPGEFVSLIKSSAIVSVIAVAEMTTVGRNIIADTFMSFEIWFTIAAVYLVLTLALSIGASALERRFEAPGR